MVSVYNYVKEESQKSLDSYLEALKNYIASKLAKESEINSIYIANKKVNVEVSRSKRRTLAQKIESAALSFCFGEDSYYPIDSIRIRGVKF